MVSVRKVESRYRESGINKVFELRNVPASRAHGANDFRLPSRHITLVEDAIQRYITPTEFRANVRIRHEDDIMMISGFGNEELQYL